MKRNKYIRLSPYNMHNRSRNTQIRGLWVSPNFAIHKNLPYSDLALSLPMLPDEHGLTKACYKLWQDGLSLTHIPSGLRVANIYISRFQAMKIIQTLESLDCWDFHTLNEWRATHSLAMRYKAMQIASKLYGE